MDSVPVPVPIFLNPSASSTLPPTSTASATSAVLRFHRSLPTYAPTPLHDLTPTPLNGSDGLGLGLAGLYLKDESARFGLPSFKILGASWAVRRALAERLGGVSGGASGDDDGFDLAALGEAARDKGLRLLTTTEGNWGRAVAWMGGAVLGGVETRVYCHGHMHARTKDMIAAEGAEVIVVEGGSYDDCLDVVKKEAEGEERDRTVLVLDMGWEGYEKCPQWVVEGYSTMLSESLAQYLSTAPSTRPVTHVIVPVGVGSIAQAVTEFWKSSPSLPFPHHPKILTVEPLTAACLQTSLRAGYITTITTGEDPPTIMAGLNCGTPSTSAWDTLRAGVDAAVVVDDRMAHRAVLDLAAVEVGGQGQGQGQGQGKVRVRAGPCGAATLAALRVVCADEDKRNELGLDENSVVVMYCTEGVREYVVPN